MKIIALAATCVLVGLLLWSAVDADAAVRSCRDTKGSVLALHTRTLCLRVTSKARRENPRWTGVKVSCRQVTQAESDCTWSITYRGGASRGKATVTGVAHPRVTFRS